MTRIARFDYHKWTWSDNPATLRSRITTLGAHYDKVVADNERLRTANEQLMQDLTRDLKDRMTIADQLHHMSLEIERSISSITNNQTKKKG